VQLFTRFSCLIFFSAILLTGCARDSHDPISTPIGDIEPQTQAVSTTDAIAAPYANNHYLWAYYTISIDPVTLEVEVLPNRQVADHWNILNWIEQAPCTDCLSIADIAANPDGTTNVYVTIKHPFANSGLTGFDVRGITMFDGSFVFPQSGLVMSRRDLNEAELVNADGYTTLYNPTTSGHGFEGYIEGQLATDTAPSLLLNGFKRFMTDNPSNTRNAFFIGDEITVNYKIDMPDPANAWVFGYAVDACWAPATNTPVEDPMIDFPPSANCPEAWKIVVEDIGPGLTMDGGTTMLQIDVYDWQGKDGTNPVMFECPALFDGQYEATFVEDGDGYTRYGVAVDNVKLPSTGKYACLISVEAAENNSVVKPWLDLTAYQIYYITVGWPGWVLDAAPPWPHKFVHDSFVDGATAYLVSELDDLEIYDVTDSADPVLLTQVDVPGFVTSVYVNDGIAAVKGIDIQILDVDPVESAHIVTSVDIPGAITGMEGAGDKLYITDYTSLYIIDIDPPESAHIVNAVAIPYPCIWAVTAWNGYAYINVDEPDGQNRFVIIDVDPPESAVIVNTIDGREGTGFKASDGYLYNVRSSYQWNSGFFEIYDVDPPESAHFVSDTGVHQKAYGLEISNGYAYTCSSRLLKIDIDPPESVAVTEWVDLARNGEVSGVTNGNAYIASWENGFQVVEVDPLGDYVAGYIGTWPEEFNDIDVVDSIAYLTDSDTGLNIVAVNPPYDAQLLRLIHTDDTFYSVVVEDGYAYVESTSGLKIVDIDPPESAYVCGSVDIEYDAIDVTEDYAYTVRKISTYGSEFQIIDVTPPESAHIVNTFELPLAGYDLIKQGELLYMCGVSEETHSGVLYLYRIEDPYSLDYIRTVNLTSGYSIDISDGYAYISGGYNMDIVDINPPESAYLLKMVHSDSWEGIGEVKISGDYACTLTSNPMIFIWDISQPASSFKLNTGYVDEYVTHLAVSDGFAYVSWYHAGNGGLSVFKLP